MKITALFSSDLDIGVTSRELSILDAISDLGNSGSTCADIQRKIESTTGKEPRLATIYSIVSDLAQKGMVEVSDQRSTENGGRPRQFYIVTQDGKEALNLGFRTLRSRKAVFDKVSIA